MSAAEPDVTASEGTVPGNAAPEVIVAGHICLDIIPVFPDHAGAKTSRIEPGKLYNMGPALFSTGGVVSNTGMALHRLGIPTVLMGKVADDLFGGEVLNILRRRDPALAEGMIVDQGGTTSYSVVISPPDVDRSFLHCPGANDTFTVDNIDVSRLQAGQIFHFGYPPLMQAIYADGGQQLSKLFSELQARQLITSLDMAMPDPQSAAGQVNWRDWLRQVLPTVDLFLPSIEEILFMLGYDDVPAGNFPVKLLHQVAGELLGLGARLVVLKLGEQGLYFRSQADLGTLPERFAQNPEKFRDDWSQREFLAPCFQVNVAGTTGAGDCTIAGFLAGFLQHVSPEQVLSTAVAVGAFSVEAADSTTGIRSLAEVQQRMQADWQRNRNFVPENGWQWQADRGVWAPA